MQTYCNILIRYLSTYSMQTCVQYSLIVINYCTVGKAVKVTKKIKNINHTYVFVAVFCKAFLDYRQCCGSGELLTGSGSDLRVRIRLRLRILNNKKGIILNSQFFFLIIRPPSRPYFLLLLVLLLL